MLRRVDLKIVADVSEQYVRSRRGIHTGLWWGNTKIRGQLEEPGVDGRITLKLNYVGIWWTLLVWLRTGTSGDCFDQGNTNSGSRKCEQLLDQLRTMVHVT